MIDARPNILFIVADDLNAWVGALGRHPQAHTPNIDRLADRATLFTRAYCPAPYCNASRMSVFTGLMPATSGIYQKEDYWDTQPRSPTYFERLRDQGYYLFAAGKIFHGVFDYRSAGATRAPAANWQELHPHETLWDRNIPNRPEPMPPARPLNGMFDFDTFDTVAAWNHHFDWGVLSDERAAELPDTLTTSAVCELLSSPPEQPFLCAAGLYKPHLPWYVPQRFFDLHPIDDLVLPVVRDDDLDDVPAIAREWALSPPDHETILRHRQWRQAVQGYLAAISYCDEQVGRMLDALDASPAGDNTMIVLWGDNGFHLGEKLHWRKFALWEEATRVPLIIAPPRASAAAPARIDTPVSLIDIFPTLFDLGGLAPLPGVDGASLVPLMTNQPGAPARPVVTTWLAGNHSVRFGPWRYTRYRDGAEELYDHASDPMEWTNLATNDSYSMQLDVSSSLLNEAMSGTRTAAHFDGSDARRDSAQRVAPAFAGRLGALRRLVWHPHQHLWNWDLMALLHRLPGGRLLERAAISVDSLMLALSSLARGVARGIGTARVLYIDCGTHQDGLQLRAVSEWLGSSVARLHLVGFEARLTHFAAAERSLADIPDLELHQVALVGPDHEGASAKLYITGGDGKGDSLYPERGTDYEAVPAARLSSFLPSSPDEYDAVLLRMNIEGAEAFVIDDLIDADALGRIDGFYGMWDDLSKIDRRRDAGFRRILRRHDVHTFTFNDRDFDSRLRLWAIRHHVRASVARAHRAN